MVRPDRDLLGGDGVSVEVDQTFIGARQKATSGPRYDNKAEVIVAVERQHPKGFGRVGQFQRSVHGPGMMPGLSPSPDRWRAQDARNTVVVARSR
jgi:hypothetical protein